MNSKKTKINNKYFKGNMRGGGAEPAIASNSPSPSPSQAPEMNLQSLTAEDIDALMAQGVLPEQIAQIAIDSGQPIPPIIESMLPPISGEVQGAEAIQMPTEPSKANKFPAMMDLSTYAKYRNVDKAEHKAKQRAHKPNVFGYVFSDLIREDILRDMKRTQGSFFVGVNLSNLFNEFRKMIINSENNNNKKTKKNNNSKNTFKKVGEWVNIDFDDILDRKMGYRGSDVPLLPENELGEYSSFYEVIDESKKYADTGFGGKITPLGLLIMTRMLYKYRKNNAQWLRVATILELIYKYFGNEVTRDDFFKNRYNIPIMALMDLEEFYNTDHIFMTDEELEKFKKELDFYKYDSKIDIKKKIKELKEKIPPPI